jgi:hypothetical protein
MRVLITGGAGFVGSSLALHLRQQCSNAAVVCLDNLYRRGSELNLPRLQKAGSNFTGATLGMETVFQPAPSIISLNVLPNLPCSPARTVGPITCSKRILLAPTTAWKKDASGVVNSFFFPRAAFIRSPRSKRSRGVRRRRDLFGNNVELMASVPLA